MRQRLAYLCLTLLTATACKGVTEVHGGGTINGTNYWEPGKHQLNGTLRVENGSLNLAAGVSLLIAAGADIIIDNGGSLELNGTSVSPVTISAMDTAAPWGSIQFLTGAALVGSAINAANISWGGSDYGMVYVENTPVTISNSQLNNSASYGLELAGFASLPGYANNVISGNKGYAVAAQADSVASLQLDATTTYDTDVYVPSSTLTTSATWAPLTGAGSVPVPVNYVIENLTIASNTSNSAAVLTVSGAALFMAQGANITVDQSITGQGGLNLLGSGAAHALVTTVNASTTPLAGDWQYINFISDGNPLPPESTFNYVDIEYGGTYNHGAIWVSNGASMNLSNVNVMHAYENGITVDDGGLAFGPIVNDVLSISGSGNAAALVAPDAAGPLVAGGTFNISGNRVNAIQVAGGNLTMNANWNYIAGSGVTTIPFEITGDIMSVNGNTLNVGPGATIYLDANRTMTFNNGSVMNVNGTSTHVAVIDANDPNRAWGSINLSGGTCNFTYADVYHGGGNGAVAQVVVTATTLNLDYSDFNYTSNPNFCDTAALSGAAVTNVGSTSTYTACL